MIRSCWTIPQHHQSTVSKIKENTFVIPIVFPNIIDRCLETLYKHTPDNFYVIVIDQSKYGMDMSLREKYKNLMIVRSPKTDIHYTGNLGFSLASNIGIKLATTKYVTFLNDDVEFVNIKWWQGVLDTFTQIEKATPSRPPLLVNVASIKLPDWSVGLPKGQHHHIIPYKKDYTEEDWEYLTTQSHYVNEHLTIQPGTVIDGINLYASVCDREKLLEVGSVDDFWYPGGADDYDLCARASMFGYRCVGTTKSWVYHHWSSSFAGIQEAENVKDLAIPELNEGDLRDKWWVNFDLWGVHCPECNEILLTEDGVFAKCPKHPDQLYPIPQNTAKPL